MKKIKYIELFSGIGAFSQAINKINDIEAKCVYAVDFDKNCSEVYKQNYSINSYHDITTLDIDEIPEHDLCFFSPPCQAFSKSGKRLGFDESRGTLIFYVFNILKKFKPKYILMENVRNLVSHDNGNTWKVISNNLKELGYRIPSEPIILSPHEFSVPQTRDRAFLPGIYDPENVNKPLPIKFNKKELTTKDQCHAENIIMHEFDTKTSLKINKTELNLLKCWDEFYNGIKETVIGFPIWYDYFYDEDISSDMPDWKKNFIEKNKQLYLNNKKFIDSWAKKYNYLKDFTNTQRKFEWQAGNKIKSIFEGIIQLRPSGVRVKAPTTFPALVAIVQIPIYGPLKRRLDVRECAKLQRFPNDFKFLESSQVSYKQLGNSINVEVLYQVAYKLLKF